MSKFFKPSLLLVPLFVIACQGKKNEASSTTEKKTSDDQLTFTAPEVLPEVSKEILADLKSKFGNKPSLSLPDIRLIFPDPSISENDRLGRELDLKQRSPDAYALMMEIRTKCKLQQQTPEVMSTFDRDGKEVEKVTKGDKASTSYKGSLNGDKECPALIDISAIAEAGVADSDDKMVNVEGNSGGKFTSTIQNQKIIDMLGLKGLMFDYGIKAKALARRVEKGISDKLSGSFNISGSIVGATDTLPFAIDVTLAKKLTEKNRLSVTEAIISTKMTYKDAKIQVVQWLESNKETGKVKNKAIYLNGRVITKEAMKSIFGSGNLISEPELELQKDLL